MPVIQNFEFRCDAVGCGTHALHPKPSLPFGWARVERTVPAGAFGTNDDHQDGVARIEAVFCPRHPLPPQIMPNDTTWPVY